METTLLIVTALSLIVALAMSVTAWRLNRDERRRSAARVAALSAAAGVSLLQAAPARSREAESPKAPWARSPRVALRDFDDRLNPPVIDTPDQPSPRPRRSAEVLDANAEGWSPRTEAFPPRTDVDVASRPILGSTEAPQASRGRQRGLAAAAAVLFVVMLGGVAWVMAGREPSAASAAASSAPLELVALRHERQSSKLAVSGLVRNPAAGHPIDRLSAVVFLFDQQGTFVTSAKAPVDFMRLGSGDESPFVIAVDAPATIARYRVSFRTDQGIVPHVDRRGASPIAAQAEQAAGVQVK